MSLPTYILVGTLLAISEISFGQSIVRDCDKIKVTTEVTNPTAGQSNGKIALTFEESSKQYKVFFQNPVKDSQMVEVKGREIGGLKAGFYDLLIIMPEDKKGCSKQLTVVLK